MRHLDRLDSLRIVTPCDVPWSSMVGDGAVRFCGQCRKNVYDVSAMTRDEALETIARTEGRVCLRLARRRDGTIATGDCWARLRRARRRGTLAFLAVLPLVLATELWVACLGLRALSDRLRPRPRDWRVAPLPAPVELPDLGSLEDPDLNWGPFRRHVRVVEMTAGMAGPETVEWIRADLQARPGGGRSRR